MRRVRLLVGLILACALGGCALPLMPVEYALRAAWTPSSLSSDALGADHSHTITFETVNINRWGGKRNYYQYLYLKILAGQKLAAEYAIRMTGDRDLAMTSEFVTQGTRENVLAGKLNYDYFHQMINDPEFWGTTFPDQTLFSMDKLGRMLSSRNPWLGGLKHQDYNAIVADGLGKLRPEMDKLHSKFSIRISESKDFVTWDVTEKIQTISETRVYESVVFLLTHGLHLTPEEASKNDLSRPEVFRRKITKVDGFTQRYIWNRKSGLLLGLVYDPRFTFRMVATYLGYVPAGIQIGLLTEQIKTIATSYNASNLVVTAKLKTDFCVAPQKLSGIAAYNYILEHNKYWSGNLPVDPSKLVKTEEEDIGGSGNMVCGLTPNDREWLNKQISDDIYQIASTFDANKIPRIKTEKAPIKAGGVNW